MVPSERMARPKNADPARTYDAILDATRSLVTRSDNPGSISLRAVAKEAGVSMGTVQYYFETRAALLEACLDTYYERMGEQVSNLATRFREAEASSDPAPLVREAARTLYRFARAERDNVVLRQALVVERGELPAQRRIHDQGPALRAGAEVVARRLGRPTSEVKMLIQTLVFAGSRYATLTDDELEVIVGKRRAEGGEEAIEDHLAEVAMRCLR